MTTWLRIQIATHLGCLPQDIAEDGRFADAGITSLQMTAVVATLAETLRRPLSPTIAWAHPTVAALVSHLLAPGSAPAGSPIGGSRRPTAGPSEPIAIVGLACRLPGAPDLAAFWSLLSSGGDGVGDLPPGRWDAAELSERASTVGAHVPRRAGFMSGRLDEFDPLFFGISPREAQEMDPQQRLFLEVAWEALEHAGHANERLAGSATGVFAGAIWNDFAALAASAAATTTTAHSATGRSLNMVANRVSYALGLRGPSMVFDSACSSSLLAVHYACQSLRCGDSSMALAGGVNVLLDPAAMLTLTLFGGLSADGRCKSFDAAADGFGRGEGCGVVVLKLLSRALADGDDVWATVHGSAVNNDGLTNGLTAPSPLAQRDVLRSACLDAGVEPAEVDFVETHGTGTALGDPIEAEALGAVFGATRPADRPLILGAVKSNIGHLEGAAGIAGVIKTALCLRHGEIPSNLHFNDPNPHIPFEQLGLCVPVATRPWPHDGSRRAGVSSFGWGGTNVHLVMGAATGPQERHAPIGQPVAPPRAVRGGSGDVPRLAFVCSPHGHQWSGMARVMMRDEPAFRAAFEACDQAFADEAGWSLIMELFAPDGQASTDVDVVQPVLFALQVSLAAWFEDAGLRPQAVVGHSLGEIAAAVIAGIIDVSDAARVVYHYSAQQQRVSGGGGMAIVELPSVELEPELEAYAGRLTVAAENGPRSTNIVGPHADLETILGGFRARGTLCARIRVDVPAHSAAIEPVLDDLREALAGMRTGPGRIPMISSVTGCPLPWEDFGPAYVVRNLRERVRFSSAVRHLVDDGFDAFVELSAHPVLLAALQQGVEAAEGPIRLLAGMRRGPDDRAAGMATVAELAPVQEPAEPREAPVVLSAATAEALRALAGRLAAQIDAADDPPAVVDIAAAALRRRRLSNRLATVEADPHTLAGTLRAFAAGDRSGEVMTAEPAGGRAAQVAFVFPGQGSQWFGMGRELLRREPGFHAAVRACDAASQPFLDWSILAELQAPESESRLDRIDVVQPILFCLQVALARLWRSWGLQPVAVLGHSMGEVAAAHVAGALSLPDAARIVCRRSRVMARASGRGAMLATELTTGEAVAAIAGHEELVSVAVSNSPRSTVLSGDPGALEQIAGVLEADEIFCRWVRVDVASHSPQMDALRDDLLVALADVQPRVGEIPIYSTVTGLVENGSGLSTEYWIDNLRRPVLFGDQVDRLLEDGVTTFVELSAHPILLPAIQQVAAERGVTSLPLPSLRRSEPERATMLRSAAQLDINDAPVELARVVGPGRRAVRLPGYPWQRERFWPQTAEGETRRDASLSPHAVVRGLLGTRLDPAGDPTIHYWDSELDLRTEAIGDHRVAGAAVVPGSVYVAMALAVAQETAPGAHSAVCDIAFFRRLMLPDEGARRVQLALTAAGSDGRLQIFGDSGVEMHLVAEATIRTEAAAATIAAPLDVAAIEARMELHSDGREYYRRLHAAGLDYGPAFRGIEQISSAAGEVLARLAPTSGISTSSLPPALLDAALQTVLAAHEDEPARMYIGEGIECIRVLGAVKDAVWVHAQVLHDGAEDRRLRADLCVTDASGVTLVEVTGATFGVLDGSEPVIRRCEHGDRALTASVSAENGHPAPVEGSICAELGALGDAGERRAALEGRVRECVGDVVRLPARRIEIDRPLRTLGIDSVMSLELRNRLETTFAVRLSATVVWNHPTVRELGAFLGQMLAIEPADPAEPRSAAAVVATPSSTPVLTDESPRLALERELNQLTATAERI